MARTGGTGQLTVYSEGWINAEGRLLDENGDLIASDSDSAAGFNFRIVRDRDAALHERFSRPGRSTPSSKLPNLARIFHQSRLLNRQMPLSSNRLIPYFEDPAGYKLRWPRPRTVGSGHERSRRRRPWGTFSRVSARGRYTIRHGYASVSYLATGAPSRCYLLAGAPSRCYLLARGAPSRCYLLARGAPSRSAAEGSEHAHAGKILRDHRGP